MTNTTPLSPAAQAVRRDFAQIMRELHQRCRVSISATDALPITLETNDSSLQAGIDSLVAAALRAAVKQAMPVVKSPWSASMNPVLTAMESRDLLLAIATELEGAND